MKSKEFFYLFLRYFVLLVLGLGNLWVFYLVFAPLTVYPVYFILKLIEPGTQLMGAQLINFRGQSIEIVSACVAGAAYYLLLILNLSCDMDFVKRMKSILFLFSCFLFVNIIRIVGFSLILDWSFFESAHMLTWNFGSTLFVVGIWFVNVWIFKIKVIPVYSDLKRIYFESFRKRRK